MRHKRLSSFVRSQNIAKISIFRRKSIKPRKNVGGGLHLDTLKAGGYK